MNANRKGWLMNEIKAFPAYRHLDTEFFVSKNLEKDDEHAVIVKVKNPSGYSIRTVNGVPEVTVCLDAAAFDSWLYMWAAWRLFGEHPIPENIGPRQNHFTN